MTTRRLIAPLAVLAATAAVTISLACSSSGRESSGMSEPQEVVKFVDPKAKEVIEAMSGWITSQDRLRAELTDTIDMVREDGVKIQLCHERELTVERPSKVRFDIHGDQKNGRLVFDGSNVTLYYSDANAYASRAFKGSVSDMLEMMKTEYGLLMPGADVLSPNMGERILAKTDRVEYLGIHLAAGRPCHHLVLSNELVDGQIWVDAEGDPVLRKFIISYKYAFGEPQYTLVVNSLEPVRSFPPGQFTADLPVGAERIAFEPVSSFNPNAGGVRQ